uniref:Uncharacterized protein n=1 Tax=Timema shepardi TaxID=629360 RepID=A0A7R9FW52_TIMSH|nr:unnamed protein product [Timema shepardi]
MQGHSERAGSIGGFRGVGLVTALATAVVHLWWNGRSGELGKIKIALRQAYLPGRDSTWSCGDSLWQDYPTQPALREQQYSLYLAVPPSSPTPSYVRMRTTVKHHIAGTVKRTVPYKDF